MNRRAFATGAIFALFTALPGLPAVSQAQTLADQAVNEQPMRRALNTLPPAVTESLGAIQAVFLDISALPEAAWQDGRPTVEAMRRLVLSQFVAPFSALKSLEAWETAAGIRFAELGSLMAAGNTAVIWRPRDPARIPPLQAHLQSAGFKPDGDGILTAPADTPIMTRMSSPWMSQFRGQVSVGRDGDTLVQSRSPDEVRAFSAVAPDASVLTDAAIETALAGLEARLGQGRIIQAALFTPAMALRAGDPAATLRLSPAEAAAALQGRKETIGQGMPPFQKGVIADVQTPAGPALLVSLTYEDCGTADTALARLRAFWDMPGFGKSIPAELSDEAVHHGQGCAATMLFQLEQQGMANPALKSIMDAYARRERTPLDIF